MADSDDSNGGAMGRILGTLENKAVMLIMAALLGISGNQILLQAKPGVVRPDPWTGTNAKDAHEAMKKAWREDVAELERDVYREIEHRLRPCDQHMKRADIGWELLHKMRQDIALIKQKLDIQ